MTRPTVVLAALRSTGKLPSFPAVSKSIALFCNLASAVAASSPVNPGLQAFIALGIPWLILIGWTVVQDRQKRLAGRRMAERLFMGPVLLLVERPRACSAILFCGAMVSTALGAASWKCFLLAAVFGLAVASCAPVAILLPTRFRGFGSLTVHAVGIFGWMWTAGLAVPEASIWVGIGLLITGIDHYLLAFCDPKGEADTDSMVVAGLVGACLAQGDLPPALRATCILLPVGVYVVYCERVRNGLNAFKATMRGLAARDQGHSVDALEQFALAGQFSPNSKAIQDHFWAAHKSIDLVAAADDPRLATLIDPEVCLEHVRGLFDARPTPAQIAEARHLLDLVERRKPESRFAIVRLRALAALSENDVNSAMDLLDAARRLSVAEIRRLAKLETVELARIWTLALTEPRLVGAGTLNWLDGASTLRTLCALETAKSDDASTQSLLALLYRKVKPSTVAALSAAEPNVELNWLDLNSLLQTAQDLHAQGSVQDAIDVLAVAASIAPRPISYWRQLATWQRPIARIHSLHWLRQIRDYGRSRLPDQLNASETHSFVEACRQLADDAETDGELPEAIYNLELLAVLHHGGEATLRRLLDLNERIGDRLQAIRQIEAALTYSLSPSVRQFWVVAKEASYADVDPNSLEKLPAERRRWFDFGYCIERARHYLKCDGKLAEAARYLALAQVGGQDWLLETGYLSALFALQNEQPQVAAEWLEKARAAKPKSFRSTEQKKAHFDATRLLAEVYLERLDRPADALPCLIEIEREIESGAATLYKLGLAYERTGDLAKARKWYDMVLIYPQNPLAERAKLALSRLKTPDK